MASRIYPTAETALGSEKIINTINVDTVLERLAANKEAGDKGKLPEWLQNKIDGKSEEDAKDDEDGMVKDGEDDKKSKKATEKKAQVSIVQETPGMEAEVSNDRCACGECPECVMRGLEHDRQHMAATAGRKIVFTHPNQINASAVEAARTAGDTQLERAILAARNDRRVALASKIVETTKEQMDKQQKLAKRKNYRITVVANAEKQTVRTASPAVKGFKSAKSLSATERQAVAQRFIEAGFPEGYVGAMLGSTAAPVTPAEQAIHEVIASSMGLDTKKTVVAGLLKTATLSAEQVARQKHYWKDELGYDTGDAGEWVDDLFTNKYDNGTKVSESSDSE